MSFYNNINNFSKKIEDEMNSREVQGRGGWIWSFNDLSNGVTQIKAVRGYRIKLNIYIDTSLIGEIYNYLFNRREWYSLDAPNRDTLAIVNVGFRRIKEYKNYEYIQ